MGSYLPVFRVCVCMRAKLPQSCLTLWTVARQAPLSMGFSRQEHWSWLPCPPPGELPHPGVEHASSVSSALQADSSPSESSGKALKRLVLPEPREDPSKRFHSVRPHSTGAAHGAASGREGRGAWGIRETSAPTTPPAYWGHRTADPSLNTFSLSLTTQAQALLTLIAPN